MSISSDDSLFGEEENLIISEGDDIDYYAVLNVARNATIEEINRAYKARCLLFHPDRHTDEGSKKDAERVFVVLRKAHETLSDPQKRSIYDAVGLGGLEMSGWQLVSRSNNVENIKREYEFLKKLRETEIMVQRIHPTSSYHVKVHLAGLFCEDPEDRYAPSLAGMTIFQAVDSAITSADRVGLSGRVKMINGKGDGQVSTSWKHSASSTLHLESVATLSPDNATAAVRVNKAIGPRFLFILSPSVSYFPLQETFDASVSTTFSLQLTSNWQGSVALSAGLRNSFISSTILRTELNQQKCSFNLTLSPMNSFVRTNYIWRFPNDSRLEAAATVGTVGVIGSMMYEQKLSRYSKIGCGLTLNYPSCLLVGKIRLNTGLSHYELHLVLCDAPEELARSVVYGVVFPYVAFQTAKLLFRGPFSRIAHYFDDTSLDDQVDEVKREDATRVVNLMRPTAERVARTEANRRGLVIVEARYGQMKGDNPAYPLPGEQLIDVTVPLQAMVADSQLRLYSVKGALPGFYDPCPGEQKMLRVVYRFHDLMHAVVVPDEMPLNIPLSSEFCKHRLLFHSLCLVHRIDQ
ncbi:J domain-containing protein [Aphelenchoides fujianensis]|nr:J domain-containing protein [Aphelenchoides fujianensis]